MMARRRALMGASAGGGYEHGTWEDLFRAIDAGTYRTEYSIGETIPLDLGTEGIVNMQIVKFLGDKTSEGEAVPVSLIAVELLETSKRYNPALSNNQEGTGNIGGWEKSELRNYLNTTIFSLIPQLVKERIVAVRKYTQGHTDAETNDKNMISDDNVWSPSYRELAVTNNNTQHESTGVAYYSLTSTSSYRQKHKWNSETVIQWWTRTGNANSATQAFAVATSGSWAGGYVKSVNSSYGVCIGFCVA